MMAQPACNERILETQGALDTRGCVRVAAFLKQAAMASREGANAGLAYRVGR
jgi:hypothetical protein